MKWITTTALLCATLNISGAELYLAPNGSDANPGTLDKPLKTLKAARNTMRRIKAKSPGASDNVIILRGGTYTPSETLVLEPQDSGTTYQAYRGETPVISGARQITGWTKLQKDLPQVDKKSAGKIWVADIEKGTLFHYMFVNGKRAQRARLINNSKWRNWPKDHKPGKPEKQGQLVTLTKNKDALKYIPTNGDAEMVCIMYQYGVMGNGVITDVNPEAGTFRWNSKQTNIRTSRNAHERGYNLENALCFIDEPGEWAVDSAAGKVYYMPKAGEDLATADIQAPHLYEIIRIQGDSEKGPQVKNITISGLTLKYTDRLPENQWPDTWLMRQWENVDGTLYITGAEDCTITDNRILESGGYGIVLNHYAQKISIVNNEVGWTGSGGIFLEGYGPGTLDVNRNNTLIRNYIHDHGLGNYWHSPSLQIYQSGHNRITHNLMQRSAYSGISMVGMNPKYMNELKHMKCGYTMEGQRSPWNYFCPRWDDFSQEIRTAVENKKPYFNRTNMKPYMHSRSNIIEYNVIVDPHSLLNEGGAIYAWCPGKDNVWRKNIVYVSHAMPGSSIYALDDLAEYFTVEDNIFWVNGTILNGVGARRGERGNKISGNHRVMFKAKDAARRKNGLGTWWKNETGRESMDKLFAVIKTEVDKQGGWPGSPDVGIPGLDKNTKLINGPEMVLPEGSNVTIEE
jgi:hypothetical protein